MKETEYRLKKASKISNKEVYIVVQEYDVIVIGAGHAGVEAGLASGRRGAKTLMLTINLKDKYCIYAM